MSENGGANGTFSPLVFANELQKAHFVVFMRASKHKYVIIVLFRHLALNILDAKLL